VARTTVTTREGAVELCHVAVGVAARGRHEAYAGLSTSGQAKDIVIQQRIVGLHREPSSPKRHDLPLRHILILLPRFLTLFS